MNSLIPRRDGARFGIDFNAGENSVRESDALFLWKEQRFEGDTFERLHRRRVVA